MDCNISAFNPFESPIMDGAVLLLQVAPGRTMPWEYTGVRDEILAYRTSAWIGTALSWTPTYDVYGPDAAKLLSRVCVNSMGTLGMDGIRHAVMCNDDGRILSDGVVLRIAEDRYRTYWLNPPIQYYVETSDLDVHGEDVTGREYFIQVDGELSLQILEDALGADLHGIAFAHQSVVDAGGKDVRVIRLSMSGNLGYEIHGPMADFDEIYGRVCASGAKFGARRLGGHAYIAFNHTEAGIPNITIHYPMPVMESWQGLTEFLQNHPALGGTNKVRRIAGSYTDDVRDLFVTPYDIGAGNLVRFDHDFIGRDALERIAREPHRTCATLEWNATDVAKAFELCITSGAGPVDDIARDSDSVTARFLEEGGTEYRADSVLKDGKVIGYATGRIRSYAYNSMISLAFIDEDCAEAGSEVEVLWGTPGTVQVPIRATVVPTPYNNDLVSNRDRDVSCIPRLRQG